MLYPKLFTTLKNYSWKDFSSDAIAGVIVGIVAIPLAIAFGIASGVTPEKGLITAIIAGFVISLLGGSRVQIGGPTGAFVVIVYGIVQKYGVDGLIIATFLAGIMLIVMGIARLGTAIKYIPHPVIVGFTSGIAVIIFSSQVKDFLGLNLVSIPSEFIAKWEDYYLHLNSFNLYAFLTALGTVLVIAFWPRVSRRIPGALVALILFSFIAYFFNFPIETIGSRFGAFPHTLPAPGLPHVSLDMVGNLIQPAFTIALLGAIESLLSAVVADGMTGGRHRSNMELVGQGFANISSALFGGIPATGAIARTVTNIKNGGKTPIAGIIHSLTILVIVLFLGKWIVYVPMACLAGILVIVAYHMSEWRSFLGLLRGPRADVVVLVVTFFLTVMIDLTVAIEIGMVLAAFLFMHRMSQVTDIQVISKESQEKEIEDEDTVRKIEVPDGVEIYDIKGPFFFGVSHEFEEVTRFVSKMPKVRILDLGDVPIIDATGLNSLKQFYNKCKHNHIHVIFSGVDHEVFRAIKTSGLYDLIGKENVFRHISHAIEQANKLMESEHKPQNA